MTTICLDWDGTLVDADQEWLPYAQESLRALQQQGHTLMIHSCRANWPEGLASIEGKLASAHLAVPVWTDAGKPAADLYIDDKAVYFDGQWPRLLAMLKDATRPKPVTLPRTTKPSVRRARRGQVWS